MSLLPTAANTEDNKETMDDRSALPAGQYLAHIVKSEMKPTKKKNGHYLNVHFKVLAPEPMKGRMFFTNLNLDNPGAVAMEIARKELNSICDACGKQGVTDSEEIHQIPMTIELGIEAATSQYPESNKILSYKSEDEFDGEASQEGILVDDMNEEEEEELPWAKK